MEKLVIIGNGMAPGRMLEELFEKAPGLYDVTIFNAEPRVNYDRIMLSPVLSGEKSFNDIIIHDEAWYESHGITLHKGEKITAIDRQAKTVTSASGITVAYDKLIIATGSKPFIAPVPGNDLPGVVSYRDLDDVEKMLEIASRQGKAVVIGGGVLGLEAAYGLKRQGMDVTVLHIGTDIMDRQLDKAASSMLRAALNERDIEIITKANTKAILGDTGVVGVELEDGRILEAELVVMAVGIRPSTQLAQLAGLAINRGIIVNDGMQTSDASIFALGECAEHRGVCYGLVAPLYESATVLADRLSGGNSTYKGSITNTKLKVTGINLFSAGDFACGHDREELLLRDASNGVYKRLILKNNRVIGAVLYGETGDGSWLFDLIKNETDISLLRNTLIFGQSYEASELSPYGGRCSLTGDGEMNGYNNTYKQNARKVVVLDIERTPIFELDTVLQPSKTQETPKIAPISNQLVMKHFLTGDQTTEVLKDFSLRIEKSKISSISSNFLNSDYTYLYRTAALMSVTSVTSSLSELRFAKSKNLQTRLDTAHGTPHLKNGNTSEPDYARDDTNLGSRNSSKFAFSNFGFMHSQNGDQTTEVLKNLSLRIENDVFVSEKNLSLNNYALLNLINASASVTLGTGAPNPVGNQIERLAEHHEATFYPERHQRRKSLRILEALQLDMQTSGVSNVRKIETRAVGAQLHALLSKTALVPTHSKTGDQTTEVLKDFSLRIDNSEIASHPALHLSRNTYSFAAPVQSRLSMKRQREYADPSATPIDPASAQTKWAIRTDGSQQTRTSRIVSHLINGTHSDSHENDVRQSKKRTIDTIDHAPISKSALVSMHSQNGDQTTEVLKDLSLRIEKGVFVSKPNRFVNSKYMSYTPALPSASVPLGTGWMIGPNITTQNANAAFHRAV